MSNLRTDEEQLNALFDFLGDSVSEASDEEIQQELRMIGIDPDSEAAHIKRMMLDAVNTLRQRALKSAREGYEHRIALMESKHTPIPDTPEERRKLFSLFVQRPQFVQYVTAQFRDLDKLTDKDIESYLTDLAELGILEKLNNDNPDKE